MKHCRNCDKCRLDLVSQYVRGIDNYSCDVDHHRIIEPFWEGRRCEYYRKDKFTYYGFLKLFNH